MAELLTGRKRSHADWKEPVKEREALDEAVTALYFSDSSKFSGTLWSIIRGLLNLDMEEVDAFEPSVWAQTMNPEWAA